VLGGLGSEEVVFQHGDPALDIRGKVGEARAGIVDGLGQILDYEIETRECCG
jgi:hypothetical protein